MLNADDPFVARPETETISMMFANGERGTSVGTCLVPLPIGHKYGQVEVRLINHSTPFLLSVTVLRKLGIIIDFETGLARAKYAGPEGGIGFMLESLPSGHYYIDLYKPLRQINPEQFDLAMNEHVDSSAYFSAGDGEDEPAAAGQDS